MKRLFIGNSIITTLNESVKSDAELAVELGVARDTIYRWRTGSTKVIRRKNLTRLAQVFNQKLKFNDNGVVEFKMHNPVISINETEEKLGENELKSIIQTMQKQIDYLLEENLRLKNKIGEKPEKKS